jgi:hypothetical protein
MLKGRGNTPEREFEFVKLLATVIGAVALFTALFPVANVFLQVIPVPPLHEMLFGALGSLAGLFVFVVIYVARWDLFFWHFDPNEVERRLRQVDEDIRLAGEKGQFEEASHLERVHNDLVLSKSVRLGKKGYVLAIASFVTGFGLLYAYLLLQAAFPETLWTLIPYSAAFTFITLAFALPSVLEHVRKRSLLP